MEQNIDFMDRISSQAERPKPIPQGSYICTVLANPREDKSTRAGTEYIEFTLQPLEALDDVDKDELAEQGGLADRTLRVTFWKTQRSEYRLREFLDNCGIPLTHGKKELTHRERVEQTAGRQVIAYIKHQPSDDGSVMYANVSSTAPVEQG